MITSLATLALLIFIVIEARRNDRRAEKEGGRNRTHARLYFVKNPFRQEPEQMYQEDRTINRHWKP